MVALEQEIQPKAIEWEKRDIDSTSATLRASVHALSMLVDADERGERDKHLARVRRWASRDRSQYYYGLNSPSFQPPDGPDVWGPFQYGKGVAWIPKGHSPESERAYVQTLSTLTDMVSSIIPPPCITDERSAFMAYDMADIITELNEIRCDYGGFLVSADEAIFRQDAILAVLREHGPEKAADFVREKYRRPEATDEEIAEAEALALEFELSPKRIFECRLPWEESCALHDRQLALAGGDPHAPLHPKIVAELEAGSCPTLASENAGDNDEAAFPCGRPVVAAPTAPATPGPLADLEAKLAGSFVDASTYVVSEPPPINPVIEGLFEPGDKVALLAQSKMKKTFLLIQAAVSLAAGRDFMGLCIPKRRKVLFINLEIKATHLHRRIRRMAQTLNVRSDELREHLYVINARGLGLHWRHLMDFLNVFANGLADVVIFDPLFKLIEGDENSAKDVKPILAAFDKLAESTGAAVVYSHHDAKGTPGDRDIRDRGAGSNVLGRDYDCGITLTRHLSDANATVVHFLPRNLREPPPVVVRFEDGLFVLANDLTPEVATSRTRQTQAGTHGDAWVANVPEAVEIAMSKVWLKGDLEIELQRRFRLSGVQGRELFRAVRDDSRIYCDRGPNRGTTPQHLMGSESDVLAEIDRLNREATERRQPWLPKVETAD